MQTLRIRKGPLKSQIFVPPSKSYANRALILAALSGNCTIKNLPDATDVRHLIDCIKKLALNFSTTAKTITFLNKFPDCEPEGEDEILLSVGEGGTTGRFLAALVLLGKRTYRLNLGERLSLRPWSEFVDVATKYGASVRLEGVDLILKGPLKLTENFEIDCSRTTQFATAFELISLSTRVGVIPLHLSNSQSYWAMTQKLVSSFPTRDYEVPSDWSSASYPLAYGALNQEIFFPGLSYDSLQADAKFLNLLRGLGCLDETSEGIRVNKILEHKDIHLDVSDCLDLVPTLAYFLGNLKGNHSLRGVENLVHKESDRLSEVIALLQTFGRAAETDGKVLKIRGEERRLSEEKSLQFPDDHRLVMAGTLFLLHHGGGSVAPAEAVAKSYPDFFSLISF